MDHRSLMHIDLPLPKSVRVGAPQRSGPLAVVPLFGLDAGARFVPPLSGLKLTRVAGYGNVELECRGDVRDGVAIVPLHIGYVQDKAQNHALCRSGLVGAGQKRMFDDACCVQQAQGGFLAGREQWFFILPIELRAEALGLRGKKDFRKLWAGIARLNATLGTEARGHLEQIICHDRYYLTQYASRFEACAGQTGALFFVGDSLVGVELAPNAAYFRETFMPLVCFSYGVAAKTRERRTRSAERGASGVSCRGAEPTDREADERPPLRATDLVGLRHALEERRREADERLASALANVPRGEMRMTEEERFLDLRLSTVTGRAFTGQAVTSDRDGLVYLSLSATPKWLAAA
jgi:hypothetical protein